MQLLVSEDVLDALEDVQQDVLEIVTDALEDVLVHAQVVRDNAKDAADVRAHIHMVKVLW